MADNIKAGEIGTLNGSNFDIGTTKLCKVVKIAKDRYSLIIEISLVGNGKIKESGPSDGLITLPLASVEDLSKETDKNIHDKGNPKVRFSVDGTKASLNIEIPTSATKQTTGRLKNDKKIKNSKELKNHPK